MSEIINVKLEHIRELKARIAQIEDDVQKELQRSQPEEWEVKVKLPRHGSKKSHTYFYLRKKDNYRNICHVYGDAEEAWERSLMLAQTPQMVSLIREIAEQDGEFTDRAKTILKDISRENWVISKPDYERCWNGRILDRKKNSE